MEFIKTSGLHLTGGNLLNPPGIGEAELVSETVYPAAVPLWQKGGGFAEVIGVSEILSQYNIPNIVDYAKGLWGSFTNNEALIRKFDSQFGTLGNGRFDLNDILAFPVNWAENVVRFIPGAKEVMRSPYGTKEYEEEMAKRFPENKKIQGNTEENNQGNSNSSKGNNNNKGKGGAR